MWNTNRWGALLPLLTAGALYGASLLPTVDHLHVESPTPHYESVLDVLTPSSTARNIPERNGEIIAFGGSL
jgi:hypothetical protein